MLSKAYDRRQIPHDQKTGISIAVTATEKQGGSDIRRNMTEARAAGQPGPGREYILTGHKWFCSAARGRHHLRCGADREGAGVFPSPPLAAGRPRNPISLERLKDKLGNKSNASTELEFENNHGWLVGEEGRGIPVVMEFMLHTRSTCRWCPPGLCGWACPRRSTTRPPPLGVPASANRSAVDAQCAGRSGDRERGGDRDGLPHRARIRRVTPGRGEKAFGRIAVALSKYWLNKRVVHSSMKRWRCTAGRGYIEESVIPRYYREAPLNGIWEGAGNVISLDVLRALRKSPEAGEAFFAELATVRGEDRHMDALVAELEGLIHGAPVAEQDARYLAERMAIALQAAALIRPCPGIDRRCLLRDPRRGAGRAGYGTLPAGLDTTAIIDRAWPTD